MKTAFTIVGMSGRAQRKSPPMVINGETLGERLARIRKEQGFTQAQLAEQMETIQPLISDYECDRLRPNPEIIVALSKALCRSADELLGLELAPTAKRKPGPVPQLEREFERARALPRAEQNHILRTLKALINDAEAST